MSAGLAGPFGVEPRELVGERVGLLEHPRGSLPEETRIALVLHTEPAHRHVVDALDAGRELVAPRDVIGRARREHLDLGVPGEMLGDVPGVQLGAAVDRLPVSLNDDGELHCGSGSAARSSRPAPRWLIEAAADVWIRVRPGRVDRLA